MDDVYSVYNYMKRSYCRLYHRYPSEIQMHKLLYFAQRESLGILHTLLFAESFEGWVNGPVSPHVRYYPPFCEIRDISDNAKAIVNQVVSQYGNVPTPQLIELTHREKSWQQSRIGYLPNERGNCLLDNEDIYDDSEKIRNTDAIWGMRYEDFDDWYAK